MLFIKNKLNLELLNILFLGPLFLYVGIKKTYSDPRVSTIFLTLCILLPFMIGLPNLNNYSQWNENDYYILINYCLSLPIYYYMYKNLNKFNKNVYILHRIIGLLTITIYLYIVISKLNN